MPQRQGRLGITKGIEVQKQEILTGLQVGAERATGPPSEVLQNPDRQKERGGKVWALAKEPSRLEARKEGMRTRGA